MTTFLSSAGHGSDSESDSDASGNGAESDRDFDLSAHAQTLGGTMAASRHICWLWKSDAWITNPPLEGLKPISLNPYLATQLRSLATLTKVQQGEAASPSGWPHYAQMAIMLAIDRQNPEGEKPRKSALGARGWSQSRDIPLAINLLKDGQVEGFHYVKSEREVKDLKKKGAEGGEGRGEGLEGDRHDEGREHPELMQPQLLNALHLAFQSQNQEAGPSNTDGHQQPLVDEHGNEIPNQEAPLQQDPYNLQPLAEKQQNEDEEVDQGLSASKDPDEEEFQPDEQLPPPVPNSQSQGSSRPKRITRANPKQTYKEDSGEETEVDLDED